jgi:hypothetical protein
MCNIINSADRQKIVFRTQIYYHFLVTIESKMSFTSGYIQTANEYLINFFARGKAYTHPLQDPIKNIICSPE